MQLIRTTEGATRSRPCERFGARRLSHLRWQEAIATGVCEHLRTDDAIFSTHRGHGHALVKGMPPYE
jgi:TPP-dependent pyruvate/acetoin dehydrogenase alpha subunit